MPNHTTNDQTDQQPERIAKVMANLGVCSRRQAEAWILNGRVRVNGVLLTSPACLVGPTDRIELDDQPISRVSPESSVWLYYKPVGLVTTHHDPEGRPTVFGSLPATMPRVISVGRLDLNSEGLLLLTNDGAFARHAELPATGWARQYRVRVFGEIPPQFVTRLAKGLTIDGVKYRPIQACVDRSPRKSLNSWISVTLHEGKNREIRKVLAYFGLQVSRLIRTAYGPYELGDLMPGNIQITHQILTCTLPERDAIL